MHVLHERHTNIREEFVNENMAEGLKQADEQDGKAEKLLPSVVSVRALKGAINAETRKCPTRRELLVTEPRCFLQSFLCDLHTNTWQGCFTVDVKEQL